MYRITFLDSSKLDIHEIVSYIRNNSSDSSALKFIKKIYKESIRISLFPYGGIPFTSKKLKNIYRKTRVDKYNIFYIIDENNKEVLIFRVLHHRRNIDNLLK